eukprot:PhM_4_TR13665/c0_g1_i1/m.70799/K11594/DDX3X, bel; ATP-dependent RNA helicase DDX3X
MSKRGGYRDMNWGGAPAGAAGTATQSQQPSVKATPAADAEAGSKNNNTSSSSAGKPSNPWNRAVAPQVGGFLQQAAHQQQEQNSNNPFSRNNGGGDRQRRGGGGGFWDNGGDENNEFSRGGGRRGGRGGRGGFQHRGDDAQQQDGNDYPSHGGRGGYSEKPRGGGRGGRGGGFDGEEGGGFWGRKGAGGGRHAVRNSFRDNAEPGAEGAGLMTANDFGITPVDAEEAAVLELFAKTKMNTGINFAKYSTIPVKCVPENIVPTDSFDAMQLEDALHENIRRAGYSVPTPIQKYALPIVMRGRDLMACAQTGSGKTAGFLIPVIQDILLNGKGRLPPHLRGNHRNQALPVGLVMSPTRELALQIYDEARKFCFRTGLRTSIVYGGVDSYSQKAELSRGCDLLVATPGRLWDLYEQNTMFLACVRFVVLDEADRMLDLGFEEQIKHIMQNSDMPPTGERQTLLFSATFPTMIQTLAKNYLHNYCFVTVGRVGSTTEGITQRVELVEQEQKLGLTEALLRKNPTALTLVFVERKAAAEELMYSLTESGFTVDTIHGDRHQLDRERALQRFRAGEVTVLVATDIASRGLDIPNVAHVIQHDMPSSLDDYIHRIGRTGRAGNTGLATAFFTQGDARIATELMEILKEHKQTVPEWLPDIMMRSIQSKVKPGGRGGGGG